MACINVTTLVFCLHRQAWFSQFIAVLLGPAASSIPVLIWSPTPSIANLSCRPHPAFSFWSSRPHPVSAPFWFWLFSLNMPVLLSAFSHLFGFIFSSLNAIQFKLLKLKLKYKMLPKFLSIFYLQIITSTTDAVSLWFLCLLFPFQKQHARLSLSFFLSLLKVYNCMFHFFYFFKWIFCNIRKQ